MAKGADPFFTRIGSALAQVEASYDVIRIACPP